MRSETNAPPCLEYKGERIRLKRWAMRPAFKFGQRLSAALDVLGDVDLARINVGKLTPLFEEVNAELAVEMIACSLDVGEKVKALAMAEEMGLVELTEVLVFNLGFLQTLLTRERSHSPNATSTPPPAN